MVFKFSKLNCILQHIEDIILFNIWAFVTYTTFTSGNNK